MTFQSQVVRRHAPCPQFKTNNYTVDQGQASGAT